MSSLLTTLSPYIRLTRLDKPIGWLLLLWPTLWALWFAADGLPSIKNLVIFVVGVILMRSAGCAINDFADRNLDDKVSRTRLRPLASGDIPAAMALVVFAVLAGLAFGLVLLTNPLTIVLSLGAVLLAACYPFAKRFTHLPQVVLGAAFSWGIPMAFAAETNSLPNPCWALFMTGVLWTIAYDTFYAMVDREDDLKAGIKSTAILFGDMDLTVIGGLQLLTVIGLLMVGQQFNMGLIYYCGILIAGLLFLRQQQLARNRQPEGCFKAFKNNNWVGIWVFVAIVADQMVTT